MGPVTLRALAGLRAKRVAALVTVARARLAVAVVLAAVAGSRRGSTALDRFIDHQRPGTITAFTAPELTDDESEATLAEMAAVPGAGTVATHAAVVVGLPPAVGRRRRPDVGSSSPTRSSTGPYLDEIARPILIDGELPLADGEAAIDEALADALRPRGRRRPHPRPLRAGRPRPTSAAGEYPATDRTETVRVGAVIREPAGPRAATRSAARHGLRVRRRDRRARTGLLGRAPRHGCVVRHGVLGRTDRRPGGRRRGDERGRRRRPEPRGARHHRGCRRGAAHHADRRRDRPRVERAARHRRARRASLRLVVLGPAVAARSTRATTTAPRWPPIGFTRRKVLLVRGLRAVALRAGRGPRRHRRSGTALGAHADRARARRRDRPGRATSTGSSLAVGVPLAIAVIVLCGLLGGGRPRRPRGTGWASRAPRSRSRAHGPSTVLGCQLALEAAGGRIADGARARRSWRRSQALSPSSVPPRSRRASSGCPTPRRCRAGRGTWSSATTRDPRRRRRDATTLDANPDVEAHTGLLIGPHRDQRQARRPSLGYEAHDDARTARARGAAPRSTTTRSRLAAGRWSSSASRSATRSAAASASRRVRCASSARSSPRRCSRSAWTSTAVVR